MSVRGRSKQKEAGGECRFFKVARGKALNSLCGNVFTCYTSGEVDVKEKGEGER